LSNQIPINTCPSWFLDQKRKLIISNYYLIKL
jgi:hypothetical protein